MRLTSDDFRCDAIECARKLIGCELRFRDGSGTILETEAYREEGDRACHLFTRPSARAFAETSPPGTAYVYLNYGVHWLLNVLCCDEKTGEKGFVLFRALAPLEAQDDMKRRRNTDRIHQLCSGPGKLTQALGVTGAQHGLDFTSDQELSLHSRETEPAILADRRVGISRDVHHPWRFLVAEHPGVSVRFGKA